MFTRTLPVFVNNLAAIILISNGSNIWFPSGSPTAKKNLKDFRKAYLHEFSALPTNTQFVERGVKESGYVSLGRRGESQRSVLAISQAKLLPEAMKLGRDEIQTNTLNSYRKRKQLQGKKKTKILIR